MQNHSQGLCKRTCYQSRQRYSACKIDLCVAVDWMFWNWWPGILVVIPLSPFDRDANDTSDADHLEMCPRAGFEHGTCCQSRHSLRFACLVCLLQTLKEDPIFRCWPLHHYTTEELVELWGVEPQTSPCKGDVLPLALEPHKLVPGAGIEPATVAV